MQWNLTDEILGRYQLEHLGMLKLLLTYKSCTPGVVVATISAVVSHDVFYEPALAAMIGYRGNGAAWWHDGV